LFPIPCELALLLLLLVVVLLPVNYGVMKTTAFNAVRRRRRKRISEANCGGIEG